MQARRRSWLEGFDGGVNIVLFCASQGRDGHVADFLSDGLHRFEVAARGDGESGFNHIHIQRPQAAAPGGSSPSVFIEKPGDCSPSRSVVSNMRTTSMGLPPW